MKIVRRILKYGLLVLAVLILLVFVVIVLFYLPPVQQYVKDKALTYAASATGYELSVDRILLKFPLNLEIREVTVVVSSGDTLLDAGKVEVGVALTPLLRKVVHVRHLGLEKVAVYYADTVSGMLLSGRLGSLELKGARISLARQLARVNSLELDKGNIFFRLGESVEDTDSVSAPLDWTLLLKEIALREVDYTMEGLSMGRLTAGGRELRLHKGNILLAKQEVGVDKLFLDAVYCELLMNEAEETRDTLVSDPGGDVAADTAVWTVNVRKVDLFNGRFYMVSEGPDSLSAAFPESLYVEGLSLSLDSIFYQGSQLGARINNLAFRERGSGIEIKRMEGKAELLSERMALSDCMLETPLSSLKLDAEVGSGLDGFNRTTPLRLVADGKINSGDFAAFIPDSPASLREILDNKEFVLGVELKGALEEMSLDRLAVRIPDNLDVSLHGKAIHLDQLEMISGNLELSVDLKNGKLFDSLILSDTSEGRLLIPPVKIGAQMDLRDVKANLNMKIVPPQGEVRLLAGYGLKDTTYQVRLEADRFGLASFLPKDSLGQLTASLNLQGSGFNPEQAEAELFLKLDSLNYKDSVYRHLSLDVNLANGNMKGLLNSGIPVLDLDLGFLLSFQQQKYSGTLDGTIRRVALDAFQPLAEPLDVSLKLKASGELRTTGYTSLEAEIDTIQLVQGEVVQKLGDIALHLLSDQGSTKAGVVAGDLSLDFEAAAGRDELIAKFTGMAGELERQLAAYRFDMDTLRAEMPGMKLSLQGGRNNPFNYYLAGMGMVFNRIDMAMEVSPEKPLRLDAALRGLAYNTIRTDSVMLVMRQRGPALYYGLRLHNATEFLEDFAVFSFGGAIKGDELTLRTREVDKAGKPIIDLEAALRRQDSLFQVNLRDTLILGYIPWQVNSGNYLRLEPEGMPDANISLTSGEKKIAALSVAGEGGPDSLRVDIENLDLKLMSQSLSFLPQMEGTFNTRIRMAEEAGWNIKGNVFINRFFYEGGRLGSINLDASYQLKELEHLLDAVLLQDGIEILTAKGSIGTEQAGNRLDLNLEVRDLGLSVAEVFMPPGMLSLGGMLNGKLAIKGTMEAPLLDGSLAFQDVTMDVMPLATAFTLEDKEIRIRESKLTFDGLGVVAPNKQRLVLDGTVDMRAPERILADLSLNTKNFQFLKAKPNRTSLVDGTGFIDLNLTAKGSLSALTIRGAMKLLDNSNINYTLRDSPLELNDRSEDMVRFISFVDTLYVLPPKTVKTIQQSQVDMQVALSVSPLVGINVNLSESGNDGVNIRGGGDLVFGMNAMGDMRLTGRYALTGGTVTYNVPVIGEKKFTVLEGNYVEWSGDLMAPVLRISASEAISASVVDENDKRQIVVFNVIIRITGTLTRPDIAFDMTAEGSIQDELAALTAEDRSKAAMSLLITGTYSAPGIEAKSNIGNNALNSLLERELNNWSRRNLKGMELTFGIDSYDAVEGTGSGQRTDYSYQFSKRFFNNRVRVKVGGRISTEDDQGATEVEENLIDDISIEYLFSKNPNYFLKVFRHTGYESALEGEVTKTGIGVVFRKKFEKFIDIFRKKKKNDQ